MTSTIINIVLIIIITARNTFCRTSSLLLLMISPEGVTVDNDYNIV